MGSSEDSGLKDSVAFSASFFSSTELSTNMFGNSTLRTVELVEMITSVMLKRTPFFLRMNKSFNKLRLAVLF